MSGEEMLDQVKPRAGPSQAEEPEDGRPSLCGLPVLFLPVSALLFVMIIRIGCGCRFTKDTSSPGWRCISRASALAPGFRAFRVVVGFLILSGAVNTGDHWFHGVLNIFSEAASLADWVSAAAAQPSVHLPDREPGVILPIFYQFW